jgi:OmpA-OmpF porin, OOP family
MFDAMLREAAARFALRGHGPTLLAGLLAAIFDPPAAGVPDLLDRAARGRLATETGTWVRTTGHPLAINSTQFDDLFGRGLADRLAQTTALPRQAVAAALAYLLPRVIRELTRDGTLPVAPPPDAAPWLHAGRRTRPAAGHDEATAAATPGAMPTGPTPRSDRFPLHWLVLLVPLAAILAWVGVQHLGGAPVVAPPLAPASARVVEPDQATGQAPAPAQSANPRLRITNLEGKVLFAGSVGDETTRAAILQAMSYAFGDAAKGRVAIDPSVGPAPWAAQLGPLLAALKTPGARVTYDGSIVTIEGRMTQAALDAIRVNFGALRGDISKVVTQVDLIEAPPPRPRDNVKAAAALEQVVQAGGLDRGALIEALNLAVVHFRTGSAELEADSVDILAKAARAIQAAPPDTRIEIGGHTDNVGPQPRNEQLSRERADAVKNALVRLGVNAGVLDSRGYGSGRPISANATEAERRMNRRMEFKLIVQ